MKLRDACAGATASSALYAAALEPITDLYTPDYTWLTVVGGSALVWSWFAAATRRPSTTDPAVALAAIYCAAGAPIIAWQLWQSIQRRSRLSARGSPKHAQHARRCEDRNLPD